MKCEATTKTGQRCRAPALSGGGRFCYHHDAGVAKDRAAARRKGGLRSHGLDPDAAPQTVRISTVRDVLDLLQVAGSDILQQEASLARSRALCYLAGVCLKALEVGSLEERIDVLEDRLPCR